MKIKIVNQSGNPLPVHQTRLSAGMDLQANIQAHQQLKPLQRLLIPTGLFIDLRAGYEAQIRPRSGLALKHGITVLYAPGTIDADYRGEVGVLIINLGQDVFTIEPGMRIAQMVVAKYEVTGWNVVESLDETDRGAGGYGSSGSK